MTRALLLLARFLCSRRGAAVGRGAIIYSASVLTAAIGLAGTLGWSAATMAWERFTAMEQGIAAIQKQLAEQHIAGTYRLEARNRQVADIERDVERLQSSQQDVLVRVIRLEARER